MSTIPSSSKGKGIADSINVEAPIDASASSSAMPREMSSRMITLTTIDGKQFLVSESLAIQSGTLKTVVDSCSEGGQAPVLISFEVISKIARFWEENFRSNDEDKKKRIDNFVKEFMNKPRNELFDMAMAANFLDDKVLLDVATQAIANNIKDLSVQKCREYMNVENDFTKEEEEAIRNQHPWVHDEENH